jgi:hypothetical protein
MNSETGYAKLRVLRLESTAAVGIKIIQGDLAHVHAAGLERIPSMFPGVAMT